MNGLGRGEGLSESLLYSSISCLDNAMECGCDMLNKKGCANPICAKRSTPYEFGTVTDSTLEGHGSLFFLNGYHVSLSRKL